MKIFKKIKEGNLRKITLFGKIIYQYEKRKKLHILFGFLKKGENIIIQPSCRIYHSEKISLGNNVLIGTGALIEGMGTLQVGSNVILGPDVTIWTATHNYETPSQLPYDKKILFKPVIIEDNVWIGAKAIITPGVKIHEGAIVGMGSVVVKDVPKGAVVGGNPAKILKYRNLKQYENLKDKNKFYLSDFKKDKK